MESSDELYKAMNTDAVIAFLLAVSAAIAIKLPALLGIYIHENTGIYARNLSLFVLPFLTGYFAWKRGASTFNLSWIVLAFAVAAFFANVYPFVPNGNTEMLTALHLIIALWLVVGIAYAGGRWDKIRERMDFIRFSGELFIYYVLIALGGGVLMAFMVQIFGSIGIDIEPFFRSWLLPCGAVGAVLIASWLADAKQGVMENMAPLLAQLFTPLFAIVLLVFLGTIVWTGRGINIERNVLIAFDLLLAVVLGMLLYSVSARDHQSKPGVFDILLVVLIISALFADTIALWAIAERITEFGLTPNRVAALGENGILLVNLAWSAVLYIRFIKGRGSFARLEQWQTNYLPVYAIWAAIVVIVFPPVFGYI